MKKNIASVGFIFCLLFSGIWLHDAYRNTKIAFAMEPGTHSEKVLNDNFQVLMKKIHPKLMEQNFKIVTLGFDSQVKEINIQVNSNQQYINKIENSIKKIIHESSQQTLFKNYSIDVYKQVIDYPDAEELALERNDELTTKFQEDLKAKEFTEIESIRIRDKDKKLLVEINTSIQKTTLFNINRGKEIQLEIKKSLTNSFYKDELKRIEVFVYNNNHVKIN
ncbi:hypothetical protein BK128_16680 [Viridibacillus sp. FSL H7-0596]|uniref:hypothetical protein n=1 Tax=Viridibacillus sp. FSL H7-0596 TaxID=1928923 RepID=UPI00096FD545|nr:hypothetical protein [Viridibacillus sp. FSL H7-0596]OMC84523.1 hypothetical protein BK128_16680 [Viridibacillus sp. FSL H7-0596]